MHEALVNGTSNSQKLVGVHLAGSHHQHIHPLPDTHPFFPSLSVKSEVFLLHIMAEMAREWIHGERAFFAGVSSVILPCSMSWKAAI
jgi:hypothetical protein